MKNIFQKVILLGGLFIPLLIFLNRFLIPDLSFDSVNYHIFSGDRFSNFWKFSQFEFFPAGLHSFPPFFDYLGGIFRSVLGYRLGSVCSLVFLYATVFLIYKIVRIFVKQSLWKNLWLVLFFINTFISLEYFFQLGTYYVDIIGTFFVIWSLYQIILYVKDDGVKHLYFGAFLMGLAVAGKLTNLVYLIPLVGMLGFWECKKKGLLKEKFGHLVVFALLMLLPIGVSCLDNIVKTGNPFFPFYNSIFKSKYYPIVNFENTNFGGRNFVEKLLWPIISLKMPARLSEGHDLFNDFKLNLYFILLLPSVYFSFRDRKKDKLFWSFNLFYFLAVMVWNFSFGYLRYAFVLEIFGGIMVLVWADKIWSQKKLKFRKILVMGMFGLLMLLGYLDKKAININLAFDIGWRKTFTYNRAEYLKEGKYFKVNRLENIAVDKLNTPDVFLNCSAPGLAFYSVSQFNNLPVVDIDTRASGAMTLNYFYQNEVNQRILSKDNGRKEVNYVTIVGSYGHINQMADCLANLKLKNYSIVKEIPVDNFLGSTDEKLIYIFGKYSL
ncbi:MAG: glycosyltransferase family 39 protein [Candidatus Margulisiibacteriota bacterium]|jgi:hypothetical protein